MSRKFEYDADSIALDLTRDQESFIAAMEKLAELNLADRVRTR